MFQVKLNKALKRNLTDQAAAIAEPKAEESKTAEPKIEEPQQITE